MMEINDLTIGQARELVRLFGVESLFGARSANHPAAGKYVVVRTYSAGVHVGVLHSAKGQEVELRECRRIWSWQGALSCTEIAVSGISGGKVSVEAPQIFLTEAIEIIPTSKDAEACLRKIR